MKGALWGVILAFAFIAAAAAADGPYTVNGVDYYKVTSTDTTQDTGTEVCASIGQKCIGYTLKTADACKLANPTADGFSSVNGDESGVYCDGAPQNGLCAGLTNTCATCPSCSQSVACDTPIGGLYREMYVECSGSKPQSQPQVITAPNYVLPLGVSRVQFNADPCKFDPNARTVDELTNEIPAIDAQLKNCNIVIPSTFGAVTKNGNVVVSIDRGGSKQEYTLGIRNSQIVSAQTGRTSCTQELKMTEATANTLLQSPNRASTAQALWASGDLSIGGCTVIRKITTFFFQPLGRMFVRNSLPTPPPQSTQTVSQFAGYKVCDFYQINKKIVTCSAYKAADTFCVISTGSTKAVSLGCDENGQVLCGLPCNAPGANNWNRCAFDNERARGNQAPPLDYCNVQPANTGYTYVPPTVQQLNAIYGQPASKPANCDDTFLPGHNGYAQNKALWDSYSADSRAVCQSQYGKPFNSGSCNHVVQLSVSGNPYYLCWY